MLNRKLIQAARDGDTDTVLRLLNCGAEINLR